jgi:galactonate dehydratase
MKITDVKVFLTRDGSSPAVFVKIDTDKGITGYGEATIHFFPRAAAGMIEDLRGYLIGRDPERIEHLWQMCFRSPFMRGGPVTGAALSGIDMALWDIKGKALKVPVYQLLGGLAREKVRLYGHAGGHSAEEIAANARKRAEAGITAIRFRGFHTYDKQRSHDHKRAVAQQVEYMEAIRSAVGDDVDIIIECHGRYDPPHAVELAKRVERFRPFLIEDPIRHENPQCLAQVRSHTSIPLAIGERGHSKWEFREIVVNRYVDYIRPDVCHCGGISEMKKIAALAETYYISLILHNNAGALGTAASMHAALAIPNVTLLEAPWVNHTPDTSVVSPFPVVEEGYALPLEGPGLGIDFHEEVAGKITFKSRQNPVLNALDGSIRDW